MDIEKIKTQMCDNYCKHFAEIRATFEDIDRGQEELDRICEHCPLNELEDVVPKEDITQKDWTDYWHKLSQSYAHTICVMAEAIAQHGVSQWIPCSERLPEYKQKIFFTEKNNETGELYVGRGMFCGVTARTCSRSNPWYYADTFSVSERRWHVLDSKIVAWLPVPQPWEGEADG